MQRFVARRVNDPHVAADLTADVFVAVIEAAAATDPTSDRHERGSSAWRATSSPCTYATGYVRRTPSGASRVDGCWTTTRSSAASSGSTPSATPATSGTRSSELDEGQRAVVELVALDGLTPAEAAAVLGISSGAARVRLHRARQHLAAHPSLPDLMIYEVSS